MIATILNTMTREELRNAATHLGVPRGKEKKNTIANLVKAFEGKQARFKVEFTLKTNPPAGQKHGCTIVHRGKVRSYDEPKTIYTRPLNMPAPQHAAAPAVS